MYIGAYYSVLVVDDDGGSVVFFSLYEFQKAGKSTYVLDYQLLNSNGFGKAGKSTCVLDYRPLNSGGSLAVRTLYIIIINIIIVVVNVRLQIQGLCGLRGCPCECARPGTAPACWTSG